MKFRWFARAIVSEGAPILLAELAVYRRWGGREPDAKQSPPAAPIKFNPLGPKAAPELSSDYDRVVLGEGLADFAELFAFGDDSLALLDTSGGGAVDIGCSDEEMLVVLFSGDYEDDSKKKSALLKKIESHKAEEFLVGELAVESALIIADSAISGKNAAIADAPKEPSAIGEDRFCIPWRAGNFILLEGTWDDGAASWARVLSRGKKTYAKRPKEAASDPAAAIMNRVSFASAKEEARALEAALELVTLGRPDLALEICAKASADRRVLAAWTRAIALAAQKDGRAETEVIALAESWLAPATSPESANQILTRNDVLRALDAAINVMPHGKLQAIRDRVVAAAEPETFTAEGDFF